MSDSSSGVTLDQVKKLLAEHNVHWVNWLRSKEREAAGTKLEISSESPSVSTIATSKLYTPQPSAASLVSQPQYGMLMHSFNGQTVRPMYTYPIMSILNSTIISQINELVPHMAQVPHKSTVPPIGPISDEMFDRYVQRW